MKKQTAFLLLLCAIFYRGAQLSLSDIQGYGTWAQSEGANFLSDPVKYCTAVYEHLDKTGGLQWIVFALCAKGCSVYFKKKRISRAAKLQRLEAEQAAKSK
jgi:hypothetical protein